MSTWMVTGGSGFLGRHALRAAADGPAAETLAVGRKCPPGWDPRAFLAADLTQPETIARAVRAARPDVVIHAAGRTPPGSPEQFERMNTRATLHLLEALRAEGRRVRLVLVGSAAELGPVPVEHLPVPETYPCRPTDVYALSKWLATLAGQLARPPIEVVVARVFNPVGPGMPAHLAFGRFVAHLMDPTAGPLDVGDLDARRDFVDVRDVARALVDLAQGGTPGRVYHVGTGVSHRVGDGLAHLLRRSGRKVEVRVDPERAGAAGVPDSRADVSRIAAEVGWRAAVPFEQSLDDLWDEAEGRSRLPLTA